MEKEYYDSGKKEIDIGGNSHPSDRKRKKLKEKFWHTSHEDRMRLLKSSRVWDVYEEYENMLNSVHSE